jgi:hypothetical protein
MIESKKLVSKGYLQRAVTWHIPIIAIFVQVISIYDKQFSAMTRDKSLDGSLTHLK